jgi:sugar lactone lactonase YvrE
MSFAAAFLLVASIPVPSPCHASQFAQRSLQPSTHRSPSGTYELFVDPARRGGVGPGRYRLTRAGLPVWEHEHPFTFERALVLEDGTAAGYGYLRGKLVLAVLAPDGRVQAREEVDQHASRWVDAGTPEPWVQRLCSSEEGPGAGRFVVVVVDSQRDQPQMAWSCALSGPDLQRTEVPIPAHPDEGERILHEPEPLDLARVPRIVLAERGRVSFVDPQTLAGAARAVVDFDSDAQGGVGMLRWPLETDEPWSFVRVDAFGTERTSFALRAPPGDDDQRSFLWSDEERWLLVLDPPRGRSRASWLDARAGTQAEIPDWPCVRTSFVSRFRDGGFLVLGTLREGDPGGLYALDAERRVLWSVARSSVPYAESDPREIYAPTSAVLSAAGEVVVLSQRMVPELQLYDTAGRYLRTVELAPDVRAKLGYEPDVQALAQGTFLVDTWKYPLRLDREFRLVGTLVPNDPGSALPTLLRARAGADGRVWCADTRTRDGEGALYALDESGTLERVLGPPYDEEHLSMRGDATIDAQGGIWIADPATHAVHAFDSSGRRLRVFHPGTTDFRRPLPPSWVAVRGDGHVFLNASGGMTEWDPDGKRLDSGRKKTSETWLFLPGKMERWQVERHGIELTDGRDEVVLRIERGQNGRWFRSLRREGAMASSGSLAVLDDPDSQAEPSQWVHVFAPNGDPIHSWIVPAGLAAHAVAFDGERVALLGSERLLLAAADGAALGLAELAPGLVNAGEPHFAPSGDELWLFDVRGVMHRLGLP